MATSRRLIYPAAQQVARIARENPNLGLGLHVPLTGIELVHFGHL